MTKVIQSMVQIVRPDFQTMIGHQRQHVTIQDYIAVPRLSLYGTYTIAEMLPMETLAELSRVQREMRRK